MHRHNRFFCLLTLWVLVWDTVETEMSDLTFLVFLVARIGHVTSTWPTTHFCPGPWLWSYDSEAAGPKNTFWWQILAAEKAVAPISSVQGQKWRQCGSGTQLQCPGDSGASCGITEAAGSSPDSVMVFFLVLGAAYPALLLSIFQTCFAPFLYKFSELANVFSLCFSLTAQISQSQFCCLQLKTLTPWANG